MNTEQVAAFLAELAELTARHGIKIDGCGCCGSPFLSDKKVGLGYYTVADDPYSFNDTLTWHQQPEKAQ